MPGAPAGLPFDHLLRHDRAEEHAGRLRVFRGPGLKVPADLGHPTFPDVRQVGSTFHLSDQSHHVVEQNLDVGPIATSHEFANQPATEAEALPFHGRGPRTGIIHAHFL